MAKIFTSLGLMSGTSGDGIDASIIKTDGNDKFEPINDFYFEYTDEIFERYLEISEKINSKNDLTKLSKKIHDFEREITVFNAKIINKILNKYKKHIDFIGYHGQTIYHNPLKKISVQLGNADLLSNLTKINVVYNFRENDLKNGGQGAPLTPIFHKLLSTHLNINPIFFVNIGGIVNVTTVLNNKIFATDIGPGMCLIDKWVRLNSDLKFDYEGKIAASGKISNNLNYYLDNFFSLEKKDENKKYIKSFDIKDFDLSFIRGLRFEDGASTLVEITVSIILDYYLYIKKFAKLKNTNLKIILSGGGRKNKYLINRLKLNLSKFNIYENNLNLIDDYKINGDFIESKAFAYLAVRSFLNLPTSFPDTTDCDKPTVGGDIILI